VETSLSKHRSLKLSDLDETIMIPVEESDQVVHFVGLQAGSLEQEVFQTAHVDLLALLLVL